MGNQIENQISIAQEMALSFRCLEDMQPGSTLNRDYFSDEFVNITHTILVLRNTKQEKHQEQRSAYHLRNDRNNGLAQWLAAKGSCDGKTLPECVTQALEELETMRQQFQTEEKKLDDTTRSLRDSISL